MRRYRPPTRLHGVVLVASLLLLASVCVLTSCKEDSSRGRGKIQSDAIPFRRGAAVALVDSKPTTWQPQRRAATTNCGLVSGHASKPAIFRSTVCTRSLQFRPNHDCSTNNLGMGILYAAKGPDDDTRSRNQQEDNKQDGDDVDFPTWVRALRGWPLLPTALSKQESKQELSAFTFDDDRNTSQVSTSIDENALADAVESARNRVAIPLASLIDMEALLMASGEDVQENTTNQGLVENTNTTAQPTSNTNVTTPLSILPRLEELGNWDQLVGTMQKSLSEIPGTYLKSGAIGNTTDSILREATTRLEYLLGEASRISPTAVQDLILRVGSAVTPKDGLGAGRETSDLVAVAEELAREQGLDITKASEQAQEATRYTANIVTLANDLLSAGYAPSGDLEKSTKQEAKHLFSPFRTARSVTLSDFRSTIAKAAEMGTLAGAIYQDTVPQTLALEHSIVANGTAEDITWMVTDSIMYQDEFQETRSFRPEYERKPIMVRTVSLRGFDASDENVDRERVLNRICTASPQKLNEENGVLLHSGLLDIARAIFKDVAPYLDLTSPTHRFVFNGHSVGGSLAVLLLLLLTEARGADFVRENVLRVFTFGSPPIAVTSRNVAKGNEPLDDHLAPMFGTSSNSDLKAYDCEILRSFGLPPSIVYGYIQPWDPIVRLFTEIDPLYPLIGDIGEDGVTPYASGPPRSLRAITRTIIESWEGWPRFRDTFRETVDQNYTCVGVQHILLPEPVRYLTDRLVSVNVGVPPVDSMLRISADELLPALESAFPLDTFRISYVPAAIRAFVHHFYPAYVFPVVEFAAKNLSPSSDTMKETEKEEYEQAVEDLEEKLVEATSEGASRKDDEGGGGTGWTVPWQFRKEDC